MSDDNRWKDQKKVVDDIINDLNIQTFGELAAVTVEEFTSVATLASYSNDEIHDAAGAASELLLDFERDLRFFAGRYGIDEDDSLLMKILMKITIGIMIMMNKCVFMLLLRQIF